MQYMFEHDEIKCCEECPFENCMTMREPDCYLTGKGIENNQTIPSWCPLIRVVNGIYKVKLGETIEK